MAKEKIGIVGGSFNPIHERHIEMGLAAQKEKNLDRLIFLPTGNPPHKREGLEDAEHRYQLAKLSVAGLKGCSVSRLEIDREGVIYTVDTLEKMKKLYPDADLYYVIGEDTMFELKNWRKPDKIFGMCKFIVCCRSTQKPMKDPEVKALEKRGASLSFLSLPPRDVSSTAIRAALAAGEEPVGLKPQALEYIRIYGLYGVPASPAAFEKSYEKLTTLLSEKRLVHSLLVSYTARQLALTHGVQEDRAALAALLHDCAKCLPLEEMQRIVQNAHMYMEKEILTNTNLLHGPAGSVLAEKEFGIEDPGVLAAIRTHTTAAVGMLPLEMIVFLADKIEPSRKVYEVLRQVREAAAVNLYQAMKISLQSSIGYVQEKGGTVFPGTFRALQWMKKMCEENK